MFIITAAPPKRAATPTAPVFMGMAIPLLLELVPAPEALAPLAVAVALAAAEDGVGMPLVNGTLEALLAPEKAGICVLADTFGVASGFRGFSTLGLISEVPCIEGTGKWLAYLSITWTTPSLISTLGITTFALLTKTSSPSMVTWIVPLVKVVMSMPFVSIVEYTTAFSTMW